MTESRGQHWHDADLDVREFVDDLVATCQDATGEQLVGVYIHGSLALGCFHRANSDIDLLAVSRAPLAPDIRRLLAHAVLANSDRRPLKGDIEFSVVQIAETRSFHHPLPFELHFSATWKERIRSDQVDWGASQVDADLAAHISVVLDRGVCLFGAPIDETFATVPFSAYLDSVVIDIDDILEGRRIMDLGSYGVLNCCRFLHLLECRTVTSKAESGIWALSHLPPSFVPVVGRALDMYGSEGPCECSFVPDDDSGEKQDAVLRFRDFVAAARSQSRPICQRSEQG